MASIVDIGREFDKVSKSLKARNVLLRKVLICAYRYIKENAEETERMAKIFEQLKRRCSDTASLDGACCHELVPSSMSRAMRECRQDVSLVPDSHPPNLDEQADEAGCPADIAYVSDSDSSSSSPSPCSARPQLNSVSSSPALLVRSTPRAVRCLAAGASGSTQQLGVGVSDAMVTSSPGFAPMKPIVSDSCNPDATDCEPPASPLNKSVGDGSLLSAREMNDKEEEGMDVLLPASRLRLRRRCDAAAAAAVVGIETRAELPADEDADETTTAAAPEFEAAPPAVAAIAVRSACSAGGRISSARRRSRCANYVSSSTATDGMLPTGSGLPLPPLPTASGAAAASGAVQDGDGQLRYARPCHVEVCVKLEPPECGSQHESSFVNLAAAGAEKHAQRGKKRKQSKIDRFFDNGPRAAAAGFRCKRRDASSDDGGGSAGKASHVRSDPAKENVPPPPLRRPTAYTASLVVGTFDPDETTLNSPGMNHAKDADTDAFERIRIASTPPTKVSHSAGQITPSSGKASQRVARHRLHLNRRLNQHSTDKPAYAYAEVVRGKKRQKLKGYSCRQCNEYYSAMNLPEDERLRRLEQVCRHRGQKQPPATPTGFWDLHLD